MNFSIARNRWIVSIALSGVIAIAAIVSSGAWNNPASASGTTTPVVTDPSVEHQKIESSDPNAIDVFGASVGIDGDTIVVGGYLDGHAGISSGAAYVYVRSGANWIFQQKLTASDAEAHDLFGIDVAISGNTIVVGAAQKGVNASGRPMYS